MRGAFPSSCAREQWTRITPAHAGSMFVCQGLYFAAEDHPRACGEHFPATCQSVPLEGSPPRMRGAYQPICTPRPDLGITPAHAGSIRYYAFCGRIGQDHPRACGEHDGIATTTKQLPGSPPRMRGASLEVHTNQLVFGITPAHAGSIAKCAVLPWVSRDHPRACGEHPNLLLFRGVRIGSPPRMRGAFLRALRALYTFRITPAHAGSIFCALFSPLLPPDHPRACGEHEGESIAATALAGSPPRMRGA